MLYKAAPISAAYSIFMKCRNWAYHCLWIARRLNEEQIETFAPLSPNFMFAIINMARNCGTLEPLGAMKKIDLGSIGCLR